MITVLVVMLLVTLAGGAAVAAWIERAEAPELAASMSRHPAGQHRSA
jgi:hypothetical protein